MNQKTHMLSHAKQRILSMLLLLAMLASSFTVDANAGTARRPQIPQTKSVEDIIRENFGEMLELFNLDQEEKINASSVTLLCPVQFHSIEANSTTAARVIGIPVVDQSNQIRCIYNIIFTETGYSTSIGVDYAPLLNAARKQPYQNAILLQDGFNLYAVTDTKCLQQSGGQVETLKQAEATSIRNSLRTIATSSQCSDAICQFDFEINKSYSQIARESVRAVNSYSVLKDTQTVDANYVVVDPVGGGKLLNNYPVMHQGNTGLCWATTIASILRYERPAQYGSITPQIIARDAGIKYDEGADKKQVRDALKRYLPNNYRPTAYSRVMTKDEIRAIIDNNDPAYMSCKSYYNSEKVGHGVALMGYSSNVNKIRIMDPAYGQFSWCYSNNGTWTFQFGGVLTFTWVETVRLLYA